MDVLCLMPLVLVISLVETDLTEEVTDLQDEAFRSTSLARIVLLSVS